MANKCYICGFPAKDKLCTTHTKLYKWESSIQGFRLKKKNSGSRYTQNEFHKNEILLTKFLEQYYGKKNIITSYHPIWALSKKNVLYEYDIYIKTIDVLIEYNGQQHYEFIPFFQKTKSNFKKQVSRDKLKVRLAKKNGKKLIIFKFDEPIFKDYVINKIEGELHGINIT
jgi:hypothetical protein